MLADSKKVNDTPGGPSSQAGGRTSNLSIYVVFVMAQVACILYCGLQACMKELQVHHGLRVYELSFFRTAATFVVSLVAALCLRQNPLRDVPSDLRMPLLIRCLCGSMAFIAVAATVKLIPLTIFQTISNLTPFVSAVFAFLWLGDQLTVLQVVSMIVCFGGIVLVTVARPKSADEEADADAKVNLSNYEIGVLMACAVVALFATSAVTTRRLKGLHFNVIQVWLGFVGLVISTIWLVIELCRPNA